MEFWELLYFAYCIKLGRSEEEFFSNSPARTFKILELYVDGVERKPQTVYVNSMRDFLR